MITIITPTGGRPEAFERCTRYVQRQTYPGPYQWIIVDDVQTPPAALPQMDKRFSVETISPKPLWTSTTWTKSTQWRNMIAALERARGEYVFIIEDDDWYHADYIAAMMQCFARGIDLVGMQPARYYNLRFNAFREFEATIDRASLCQTAWTKALNTHVIDICREETWIDGTLWQGIHHTPWKNSKEFILDYKVVGIKGMPGRDGFSNAHRDVSRVGWQNDPDRSRLRQWLGLDAALYDEFGARKVEEPPMTKTIHLKSFIGIGGQKRYRCPECEFDHYSQAEVVKHVAGSHAENMGLSVSTILDSNEKPIKRTIHATFDI